MLHNMSVLEVRERIDSVVRIITFLKFFNEPKLTAIVEFVEKVASKEDLAVVISGLINLSQELWSNEIQELKMKVMQ